MHADTGADEALAAINAAASGCRSRGSRGSRGSSGSGNGARTEGEAEAEAAGTGKVKGERRTPAAAGRGPTVQPAGEQCFAPVRIFV
jgi:hypothetical protein